MGLRWLLEREGENVENVEDEDEAEVRNTENDTTGLLNTLHILVSLLTKWQS